ncbi:MULTISPECIES: hypothetical protein [unclassified Mesorhizobium]|uniref:hypothetical protein n=1 Tax=unclassified Mesorhizobium TaxID=325217 RepID=UPI0015E4700E|nr:MULTISPECIES: hypothetical protein [unclassified Mesorhizobium]UCI30334.1 hypothetical protein FJW03_21335 [Mesorhizobium sp. B4-1-4]
MYNRSLAVSQRFWMHPPETTTERLPGSLRALEKRDKLALLARSGLGEYAFEKGSPAFW